MDNFSKGKVLIIFLILISVIQVAEAQVYRRQNNNPHEFSVWGATGMISLRYGSGIHKKEANWGGMAGLGYTYFFSERMGIGTGVEWANYRAKVTLYEHAETYWVNDGEEEFEFRSVQSTYKEEQKAGYINIPVMFHYQQQLQRNSFAGAAGVKIGIPLDSKYESSAKEVVNTGYFPRTDELRTDESVRGIGAYRNRSGDGDLDFNTAVSLSLEAGIKWRLTERFFLYTQLFFDYGLNNVNKKDDDDSHLVNYNRSNPEEFSLGSILKSSSRAGNSTREFVTSVSPMSFGVKLKLAFR